MVFSSTIFLFLFLPIALIGYYNPIWKGRKFKNGFLLLASLGFYAWGEPLFVFVMLLSIAVNWFLVLRMAKQEDRKIRKRFLTAAIVYDIALIFVFKYAGFAARNIGLLLHSGRFAMNIALPIGISFFTFQIMSYVFDVYYRKAEAQRNLVNVALYISLFPQLIAGPIVRYETVAAEIEGRRETAEDFTAGMARFVMGLAKKLLIANYAGFIADRLFALTGSLSAASAWLGAIAYTLQIYFDFSAYSDMAIGLGRMFGFHFLENFNYSYIADSITDFWRRWHMSLSGWFRDYVYIPLGGSRAGRGRLIFNLLAVWLLTGVWHGAAWTFIAWGLFYFVLLAIERFTGFAKKLGGFSHVYALFFVVIGWVLFRSESFALAGQYLGALFGFGATGLIDDTFLLYFSNGKWILLIGIVLSTPIAPLLRKRFAGTRAYRIGSAIGLAGLFALSLLVCIKATYNPFIYFNF
ncbi:MAG: MBOAT family protein [Treponema sp.]|jgi:D-alanyl-lipoteichoic acid acyltransferase DltB (MBOAT superfamily)|nr:MBOAT family protein [Treponema sp.]